MSKQISLKDLETWIEGRIRTLTSHRDRMLRLFSETDLDVHLDKLIASNSKMRGYVETLEYIRSHYHPT